jgi:hypothetical protein
MLKKTAIIISSMLLGVLGGGAVGWLAGRTIYFFVAELPNRNLSPEQFTMASCGLNLSIGMLTFFVLIPAGVVLGSAFGFGIGMRQPNEVKVAKEGPAQQCERRRI